MLKIRPDQFLPLDGKANEHDEPKAKKSKDKEIMWTGSDGMWTWAAPEEPAYFRGIRDLREATIDTTVSIARFRNALQEADEVEATEMAFTMPVQPELERDLLNMVGQNVHHNQYVVANVTIRRLADGASEADITVRRIE